MIIDDKYLLIDCKDNKNKIQDGFLNLTINNITVNIHEFYINNNEYIIFILMAEEDLVPGDIVALKKEGNDYRSYIEYDFLIPILKQKIREIKLKRILT
jgi:hypothetical protein